MSHPLIQLRPYQDQAFRLAARVAFFMWRRQSGKSYFIAAKAFERMLARPSHSCFVVSASINTGREVIAKEASIWHDAIASMRSAQGEDSYKIGGNLIDRGNKELLAVDDIAEIMEKQSAEIRLYHSNTSYSRTRIIAPNPDTARGWTGDVFGDEFAFWPHFREVWDGVEPIISSNPNLLLWLFTTPPMDADHPSYELLNPGQRVFEPKAEGNWYATEGGYPVHRVDAYDSDLAGVPMYDSRTGKACSYEEYRATAIDRASADRNYLLKFREGGTAAISKAHMDRAQAMHAGRCRAVDMASESLSSENLHSLLRSYGAEHWLDAIKPDAATAMGLDLASTTKRSSNPSALTITQYIHGSWYEILTIRFKTAEYAVLRDLLRWILHSLPYNIVSQLSVDTSNEKFAGSQLAADLSCPVVGYSGGQNVRLNGVPAQAKYAMGVSYCRAYEDGRIAIAGDRWLADDRRSVLRNGDKFETPVSTEGYHADSFDSGKLALWGLLNPSAPDFMPTPCQQVQHSMESYDDTIAPNNSALQSRAF